MHVDKDNYNIDFDSIDLSSYWNDGEEKESKMHRIHAYPAKFPAFITTKAIRYALERKINIKLVADVFCGCGTVSYETARNGKDFWGCDINPVATLIAETKSYKYQAEKLNYYYELILNLFEINRGLDLCLKNINNRISYWFKEKQIEDLYLLKKTIIESTSLDEHYLHFFLCAFSNILKPTSVWLTKSIKPQVDPNKNIADVLEAFIHQYNFMYNANIQNQISKNVNVKIENINFLEKEIKNSFVDLIVTSPPYVTSYEYADLHQLSTLWLGYTDDYKSLRDGTIGSLYHSSNYGLDLAMLNKTGKEIVLDLEKVDRRKAKAVAKYFVDMQKAIAKSYNILNSKGMILFVIGNTEYKSVKINNSLHLLESMVKIGFSNIEIYRRKISKKILTPYRDEKGRFTTDKNSRKVYSEEFIIIGEKDGNR